MKRVFAACIAFAALGSLKAQDSVSTGKKPVTFDLSNRANDHLMVQYGVAGWTSVPDSAKPGGFSRFFNIYFMLDRPFKNSPHYSMGFGAGIGSDNIFFKDKYVNLKATGSTLPFTDVSSSSSNHYKKFKLTSIYLDIPVEIRYAADPETGKGLKGAIGLKLGLLLKAYTKGKNAINSAGTSLYSGSYIMKESDKHFINSTRLAVTGRLGLGHISLYGSYSITSFLKSGAGPEIRPYNIGIAFSGL